MPRRGVLSGMGLWLRWDVLGRAVEQQRRAYIAASEVVVDAPRQQGLDSSNGMPHARGHARALTRAVLKPMPCRCRCRPFPSPPWLATPGL